MKRFTATQRVTRFAKVASAALLVLPAVSAAQESIDAYPSKAVTIVGPYVSGGPNDINVRTYTDKLSEMWGKPIIIDYKPGGGFRVGASYAAKQKPDGYTLMVVTGSFTVFPALYNDLGFDTLKDFAPVSQLSESPMLVFVRSGFPAKTMAEYVAYAKANPGKISWGTNGSGSTSHLAAAWVHVASHTRATFIPYKSTPQMVIDMLDNRLDVTVGAISASLPMIKEGKIRALAVSTNVRSPLLPDVPTAAETGLPGYHIPLWEGISSPAGTPPAVLNKVAAALERISKMPDVVAYFAKQGGRPLTRTPAQFREHLASETARWKKFVQDNGIKAEE